MRARAFTLLELLLVIAITSVLSSLLLPALVRARNMALDRGCTANLRQWGIATHLFIDENQGYLPKDGALGGQSVHEGWYVDLPRAIGLASYESRAWRTNPAAPLDRSPWICPRNTRRSNTNNLFHYCLNREVNGGGESKQVSWTSIPFPGQVPWLFDNGRLAPIGNWDWVHTNLHNAGAHFLFLDGHAAWFQNRAYWDFIRNRGRTNHPDLNWRP